MRYLREEQYYIDAYDLHTIEECLDMYWGLREGLERKRGERDFEKFTDDQFSQDVHKACSYVVNSIKGHRYKYKSETISGWMERDRKIQEKFDRAVPPDGVLCDVCSCVTKVISKDLMDTYEPDSKVLFMFECVECSKRHARFSDGSIWERKLDLCPECSAVLVETSSYKNEVMTTNKSCTKCSYKKKDVHDFAKSSEEFDKKQALDKESLEKYRSEFCYTDEQGKDYWQCLEGIKRLMDEIKTKEVKEKDPVYQKAKALKILKINKLKEIIRLAIESEGYVDLQLQTPEMGQHVVVGFTVSDSKDERAKYDSANGLKKLINNALIDSNWRLMSEGISYRLGILSGKLKAYENEEDLVKLVK